MVARVLWGNGRGWIWIGGAALLSFGWSQFVRAGAPDSVVSALGPGLLNVVMYFVFFAVGLRFSPQIIRAVSTVPIWVAATTTLAWATWVVVSQSLYRVELLEQIFGVMAGLSLARLLSWVKPLRLIGARTLQIYLSHTVVIVSGIAIGLAITPSLTTGAAITLVIALVVIAILVGLLLNRVAGQTWLFVPPKRWTLDTGNRGATSSTPPV